MKLTENTNDTTKMVTGYVHNTSEGNLPATAKWNSMWGTWQVNIDGELSGEFKSMKDAIESMKDSNVQGIKIVPDKSMCLHHINEDKTDNSFINLIFVCRSCHIRIHNSKILNANFSQKVLNFKTELINTNETYNNLKGN